MSVGTWPEGAKQEKAAVIWRKIRRTAFLSALFLGDFSSPLLAFLLAFHLRYSRLPDAPGLEEVLAEPGTVLALSLSVLAHMLSLWLAELYRTHKTFPLLDLGLRSFFAASISMAVFYGTMLVFHSGMASRIFGTYMWLTLLALTLSSRLAARCVVIFFLYVGMGIKKVVIVGHGETANRLLRAFSEHPEFGYKVIGLLSRSGDTVPLEDLSSHRVSQGTALQVFGRVERIRPHLVVVAGAARRDDDLTDLIARCNAEQIEVRVVPDYFDVYSSNMRVDRIGNIPMLQLRSPRTHMLSRLLKRSFDLGLALLMLPVLLAVLVRLRGRARAQRVPLLVKRTRVGLDGAPFPLYGLNPLLWLDEAADPGENPPEAPLFFLAMPQILNVLRGEMGIVGPRAETVERIAHLSSWEKRMLTVRPGIIGYAPVNSAAAAVEPHDQLAWDVEYLDNQSLAYDLDEILTHFPELLMGRARIAQGKEG